MSTTEERGRPAQWRERADAGTFEAWLAQSRVEALREMAIAAVVTAPVIAFPFVFGDIAARQPLMFVAPLLWALLALAIWGHGILMLFPQVRFRVDGGRLTFGRGAIPALRTASLPLGDVLAVRAMSRSMTRRSRTFDVWDLVVDARNGESHRVKLSWASGEEAAWMATRVGNAAGLVHG